MRLCSVPGQTATRLGLGQTATGTHVVLDVGLRAKLRLRERQANLEVCAGAESEAFLEADAHLRRALLLKAEVVLQGARRLVGEYSVHCDTLGTGDSQLFF